MLISSSKFSILTFREPNNGNNGSGWKLRCDFSETRWSIPAEDNSNLSAKSETPLVLDHLFHLVLPTYVSITQRVHNSTKRDLNC
jgi:hypothetical protein